MAVRLRFAPSPTGMLHLGGLRTALFNFLFARKHGGAVVLRLEDTDRTRMVDGAAQHITDALSWAGITFDEGPHVGGSHGPYVQSERLSLYKEHADRLLHQGAAYRCFCSKERLAAVRSVASATGRTTAYDRACRNLSPDTIEEKLQKGESHTVRLKVPLEGTTEVQDHTYGLTAFNNSDIDDQILMKADGFPTYHFANVVDDHLMNITHVMRGEEWLSSTPKHVLIYRALGWQTPNFVHLPLLVNRDRSKLSKRAGAVGVDWLKEQGMLPSAVCDFVARLGWSPQATATSDAAASAEASKKPAQGHEEEEAGDPMFYDMNALAAAFDASRFNRSPAAVDMDRLRYINRRHLRHLTRHSASFIPAMDLFEQHLEGVHGKEVLADRAYVETVLLASRDTYESVRDIATEGTFFFTCPDWLHPEAQQMRDSLGDEFIYEAAAALSRQLAPTNDLLTDKDAKKAVKAVASSLGCKVPKVMQATRYAVTGRKSGPSIVLVMQTLGRETVIQRLQAVAANAPAAA